MTNEEAKEVYNQAVEAYQAQQFAAALAQFDTLDRERPNSRHVVYHRALCLLGLGRIDDAQECCGKLEGKLEADKMSELRDRIATARALPGSSASFGSGDSFHPEPVGEGGEGANLFVIEGVFPVSTGECTVTGHVKSGVFHQGDSLTIVSPEGMPLLAPVLRIGTADTPLKIVRAGQKTVMLLQVEPHHVMPGSTATCAAQEESYAATMVVGGSAEGAAAAHFLPELLEVERMLKNGAFEEAKKRLEEHLAEAPDSGGGHRLMARVYLEASDSLRNPKSALEHVRKSYELGGAEDPAVVNVLADALAANGEAEHGLRFLERLHATRTEVEAVNALAKRIHEYRTRNNLGHVWEFSDAYGEVVFESRDLDEIAKALNSGSVARDAKCRRDHVGEWRAIEDTLAPEHPEIAKLYKSAKKGGGTGKIYMVIIALLVLGILAALYKIFG